MNRPAPYTTPDASDLSSPDGQGLSYGIGRPPDVLTERSIDVRLVSATATSLGLKPGYDVRVEPQRNLLLYRPVEDSAPGVGPVENLRGVGRVDPVVWQSLQRPHLRLDVWGQQVQRFRRNLKGEVLDFVQLGGPRWMVGGTIFEMWLGAL